MIWLHIGMPKAGSSSLQAFLAHNDSVLSANGAHYVQTGRVEEGRRRVPLPSHNTLAKQVFRNFSDVDDALIESYISELERNKEKNCIISGEMFFGIDLSSLNEKIFSRLDTSLSVVLYIRRFSDFLEADYKQKAKNGRINEGVEKYVETQLERVENDPSYLNFSHMARNISSFIPNSTIIPRIFDREELFGSNIITDFLSLMNVPVDHTDNISLPHGNRSLSRVATEALGLFLGEDVGVGKKFHRQLDSALQASESGSFFGKGDVFHFEEALRLNEKQELKNRDFVEKYFPNRPSLFRPLKEPADPCLRRGHPSEDRRFKEAVHALLKIKYSLADIDGI